MEQPNLGNLQRMPLERLVSDALGELERLGYSRRSRNRYRAVWQHLIEYSGQNKLGDEFSRDLAVRFVEEHRDGADMETPGQGWRKHMVWGVALLADLAEKGRIERAFTDVGTIHLDPAMEKTLGDYVHYCRDRLQLRPGTLHERKTELTIFLDFLHSRKARALDQIQPLDLSDFITARADLPLIGKIRRDRWLQPKTVARIVSDMRSLLRFLTMRGILQKDLSAALPTIRVPRDAKIPSVWDQELIVRLLEAVDRSSAKGKRDYAILLLACRLGLRAGDIRTLKLDQLHWEDSTIEITQSKTGTPLRLPLTSEVGDALIDYLKSGRPQTTHREIFLKVKPPFDPFTGNNLHHIVTYWRLLAGIRFRTPQKRGAHSLRHTLATRLLERERPSQRLPRFWDTAVWNQRGSTRRRMWKLYGVWRWIRRRKSIFVPRMLTEEELRKFFRAVDTLEPTARSPLRHRIMPEVFRLLYGCGFRVREVLNLWLRLS